LSDVFDLTGRVAAITGGAGLLGEQHARAIARAGGIPVLLDVSPQTVQKAELLATELGVSAWGRRTDITQPRDLEECLKEILGRFGHIDILINNAANNPKVGNHEDVNFSRFESFPLQQWAADIDVGLTGAFLCSQTLGSEMAKRGRGVIVNVASDLALIGLTRYLATYWADRGIRVNAISPGGVFNGQPKEFVVKLSELIPLGRMASLDEYQGAILFLCSDASSYMTGSNLVIDGGRTCW